MGRPRIHTDNAAKQKAYRLRKYGRPPMSNAESLECARSIYVLYHGKSDLAVTKRKGASA
jgi:hypothetical protein